MRHCNTFPENSTTVIYEQSLYVSGKKNVVVQGGISVVTKETKFTQLYHSFPYIYIRFYVTTRII